MPAISKEEATEIQNFLVWIGKEIGFSGAVDTVGEYWRAVLQPTPTSRATFAINADPHLALLTAFSSMRPLAFSRRNISSHIDKTFKIGGPKC